MKWVERSSQLAKQFKQLLFSLKKRFQGYNEIRTNDLRDTGALLYQLSYEVLRRWEQVNFGFLYPACGMADVMNTWKNNDQK